MSATPASNICLHNSTPGHADTLRAGRQHFYPTSALSSDASTGGLVSESWFRWLMSNLMQFFKKGSREDGFLQQKFLQTVFLHIKMVPNQWIALKVAFKFSSDLFSLDKQDGNWTIRALDLPPSSRVHVCPTERRGKVLCTGRVVLLLWWLLQLPSTAHTRGKQGVRTLIDQHTSISHSSRAFQERVWEHVKYCKVKIGGKLRSTSSLSRIENGPSVMME